MSKTKSKISKNLILSALFVAVSAVGVVSFVPSAAHAQYYSSGYNSGYSGYSGYNYPSSYYGYNGYQYCTYGYNQGCSSYYPGYSNSYYPYYQYNNPYYNYPYGYPIYPNNGYGNGYGGGYGSYYQPLQASCSASLSTVNVGSPVTWSVTAWGGRGNYTYNWSGDGVGNSYSNRFTIAYTTPGTKSVAVTVISDGQSVTASCGTVNVQGNYGYPYYW